MKWYVEYKWKNVWSDFFEFDTEQEAREDIEAEVENGATCWYLWKDGENGKEFVE